MKRGWMIIVGGLIIIGALIITLRSRHRDIAYQGKSLSAWIFDVSNRQALPGVLRALGPRCIPFIVTRIARQESFLRKGFRRVVGKLPRRLTNAIPREWRVPGYLAPVDAGVVLSYFGPAATPHLFKLTRSPNAAVRQAAALALGNFGGRTPAVQSALRRLAGDPDKQVAVAGMMAGLQCGLHMKLTVRVEHIPGGARPGRTNFQVGAPPAE
jgi:HEAT repeats